MSFKILTQLQISLTTVHFFNDIFNPTFGVCPYLTQMCVDTIQHFLEFELQKVLKPYPKLLKGTKKSPKKDK